jgi:hypothetical protein
MHEVIKGSVYAICDSLRAAALDLDENGDGCLPASDYSQKSLLELLRRELPTLNLSVAEVGALAAAFEGRDRGSLVVDDFMYSVEQVAMTSLSKSSVTQFQTDYER